MADNITLNGRTLDGQYVATDIYEQAHHLVVVLRPEYERELIEKITRAVLDALVLSPRRDAPARSGAPESDARNAQGRALAPGGLDG